MQCFLKCCICLNMKSLLCFSIWFWLSYFLILLNLCPVIDTYYVIKIRFIIRSNICLKLPKLSFSGSIFSANFARIISLTLLPSSALSKLVGCFSSFKMSFTIILSILLLKVPWSPTTVGGLRFCISLIIAPFFYIWILEFIKSFTFLLSFFIASNFRTIESIDMLKACIEGLWKNSLITSLDNILFPPK